ncbi:MAG: anion transporter [Planctomycetes bacterium]|nr:anion transporter [Planctomycetota bacterium]
MPELNASIIVLLAVFILIAVRQVLRIKLQIWHIMLAGAGAVLVAGEITPVNAVKAIDIDVILFLFGMFVAGEALHQSGYLSHLSYKIFKRAGSIDHLILLIIIVIGGLSAFLMNDTLAIIGTPLMLYFSRAHKISPKILLLCLAFAVTTGSVLSPIGNPQNLLIAINGNIQNPFVTFFKYLAIPTFINLLLIYAALKLFYREHFHDELLNHYKEPIEDSGLAFLSRISLIITAVLILAKILIVSFGVKCDFRLTYIALAAAFPVVAFSPKRFIVLKNIDWGTLVFFAAMFVLMRGVWDTGFFQEIMAEMKLNAASLTGILFISIVLSQFISNVPLVALCLPMLITAGAGAKEMASLAAGSTIAGNLSILGAASNVIIIQNAEKQGKTLTFWEFIRIGLPLTLVQAFVYWLFLNIL